MYKRNGIYNEMTYGTLSAVVLLIFKEEPFRLNHSMIKRIKYGDL